MFFEISPVRRAKEPKPIVREAEPEKVEVLSLGPFAPAAKLFFDGIKVGDTASCKLLLKNPTKQDLTIFLTNKLPEKLNVSYSWENSTIERNSEVMFTLTWTPLCQESSYHKLRFESLRGNISRDVPVALKSLSPKKTKATKKTKTGAVPRRSPIKKSPTKKYYATSPLNISTKKYSPSSRKVVAGKMYVTSPSPPKQYKNIKHFQLREKKNRSPVYERSNIENKPILTKSNSNFDYERRDTFCVERIISCDFNDSLESNHSSTPQVMHQRPPLTPYNEAVATPDVSLGTYFRQKSFKPETPYGFEYKLQHLDSLNFSIGTPLGKNKENFSPDFDTKELIADDFNLRHAQTVSFSPSPMKYTPRIMTRNIKKELESIAFSPWATPLGNADKENFDPKETSTEKKKIENETFNLSTKSNLSSETYVKSNLSSETYVIGSPTFAKILSPPPPLPQLSVKRFLGEDIPKSINSLIPDRQPLGSIQEESMSQFRDSYFKKKCDLDLTANYARVGGGLTGPKDWSRKSGTAFRISKSSSGLKLTRLADASAVSEKPQEAISQIIRRDTNSVIIQNPFLLAATDFVDPFMTPHLQASNEWLDQQEIYFKKWLNSLLTPPQELQSDDKVVDVAKVWQECKKRDVEAPPTKEEISSKYHINAKLNSLRKSARTLYRSKEMSEVLTKVLLAVDMGKLSIRQDKDVHLNLSIRSEIMKILLNYNPLWLRIGLETVYNETINLHSNSDLVGLSTFMLNRLFKDPYLIKKFKSTLAPKYIAEFNKFFIKKFLSLVYFLDQAKNKKLIAHNPCLFCRNGTIKASRELLLILARELLSAVGDITKFLKFSGYVVSHVQTYIHEFDYAVNQLGVDLRDGVRLTRVMEIISMEDDLTSNLRVPAISRLQKVHNMKLVFNSLEKAGYKILYDISPKDIVDGHREKTMSFLWQIIYKFEAPLMVKCATTVQVWFRSLPVVLKRRRLQRNRLERENAAKKIQNWFRRHILSRKLTVFAEGLKEHFLELKIERSALRIQTAYRMYRQRKVYRKQIQTVRDIQRVAKGFLIRNSYMTRIKSAILIQSYWRMFVARKVYLRVKTAAQTIQILYRSWKQMKTESENYQRLKSATVFVQRKWRAKRMGKKQREEYTKLKYTVLTVQLRYFANKLRKIDREKYQSLRTATIKIQTWFRSIRAMRTCRKNFLILKHSVSVIEQRYSALKSMQRERENYQTLRKACITVQSQYRAQKSMKRARVEFLQLRESTIVVQRRYRAKKLMENQVKYYKSLKRVTVVIQRRYRAHVVMKTARNDFVKLKNATVKIQAWFRAVKEMRKCREEYLMTKNAVRVIENRYQAQKLMKDAVLKFQALKKASLTIQCKFRALISMRECREEYSRLKQATLITQRRFRANRAMKSQRNNYRELKRATVVLQTRFRATREMQKCQKEYKTLRNASLVVQRTYRANQLMKTARTAYQKLLKYTILVQRKFRANRAMKLQRREYLRLKDACVVVQTRFRANRKMQQCKIEFSSIRKFTILVQRRYRANKLMVQTRKEYKELLHHTVTVQRLFRANRAMKIKRSEYLELKKSAVAVQSRFRANQRMKDCKECYQKLRNAALIIQRRYRANRLMKKAKTEYQELLCRTLTVQRLFRAKQSMIKDRSYYVSLRESTLRIQARWRANRLCKEQNKKFIDLKKATVTIQQNWKAYRMAREEKSRYQKLRTAAICIQRRWRARKIGETARKEYFTLRKAALILQTHWRSKKLAEKDRKLYVRKKNAATILQRKLRATLMAKIERTKFETIKKSSIILQARWRAHKARNIERQNYQKLRESTIYIQKYWRNKTSAIIQRKQYLELKKYTCAVQRRWRATIESRKRKLEFLNLRKATIFVQQKWRAKIAAKKAVTYYRKLKTSTVTLQIRYRAKFEMRLQRNTYLEMKNSAITIQRWYRACLLARETRREYLLKKKSVIEIQRYIRGFLIRKKYAWYFTDEAREQRRMEKVKNAAATKIQAFWRGYNARCQEPPNMKEIRLRYIKARAALRPENTVEFKCNEAVQMFVREGSTLMYIIKALEDIDYATRRCKNLCVKYAKLLPEPFYILMSSMTRSLPEMNACILAVNCLINFNKLKETKEYSFVPQYIDVLVKIMMHWCDKESQLFPALCTLFWLFAHNPQWKRFILKLPHIQNRLEKLEELVTRKSNMVQRQAVKGHTVFGKYKNLPMPYLHPDWGLNYKAKPFAFTNSVHALNSILTILRS